MNANKLETLDNFIVEKAFFIDHTGPRLMSLDEEINEEYEAERSPWLEQQKQALEVLAGKE